MRLNSRGDFGSGVLGDGGIVTVNGVAIAGPSAQFGGWMNDDMPFARIYNDGGPSRLIHARTGITLALFSPNGTWPMRAGGGVWAAHDEHGTLSSIGFGGPGVYVKDVGPDGAIAYTPHANRPVRVREKTGENWLLTHDDFEDLQLLGSGRAIWREGFTIKTAGSIPVPVDMPAAFFWFRAAFIQGGWWCCYQDGHRIALRTFAKAEGYSFSSQLVYRPDLCELPDGTARLVWATAEGEQPNDLQHRELTLREPRVSLLGPPPPPVPVPPVPEPPPMPDFPYALAIVQSVDRDFPHLLKTNTIVSCGEFTERVLERLVQVDADWGHVGKGGAQKQYRGHAVDAVMSRKKQESAFDIIIASGGREPGESPQRDGAPAWGEEGSFGQPWKAFDGVNGETPVPSPTPGPEPPPQPCECKAELAAIRQLVEQAFGQLDAIKADATVAKMDAAQALALAQQPHPLPALKIEAHKDGDLVSTGSTWSHSHQIKLRIVHK